MTGTVAAGVRRVLVVDDEPTVREVLGEYLRRAGYEVREAVDGPAALAALESMSAAPPDLVVLDLMLPRINGFAVLAELRRRGDVPVIILTARGEEPDRILGFDLGADDYVIKPFSPRELTARVHSVLRRAAPPAEPRHLHWDRITVDEAAREVLVDGAPVELTPKEFDLLLFLASSPRQVFRRAELLEHVWASSPEWQDASTVTVHIRRLRHKIEADPEQPRHLVTVWGVGYRFEP